MSFLEPDKQDNFFLELPVSTAYYMMPKHFHMQRYTYFTQKTTEHEYSSAILSLDFLKQNDTKVKLDKPPLSGIEEQSANFATALI
jgi:hypothetical protein